MRPITLNLPSSSDQLINTAGCLTVHATRETSGSAPAVYRLWDGTSAAGTLLLTVSLTASESTRDDFREHHLTFRTGLYYELVSGALEGQVSLLVEHRCDELWHALLEQALGLQVSSHG